MYEKEKGIELIHIYWPKQVAFCIAQVFFKKVSQSRNVIYLPKIKSL